MVAAKTASTAEDTAVTLLAADLLAGATDVDGDGLTLSSVGNAVGGSVVLNGDGTVTFTPDADVYGAASFDYTVSDGQGGFATETVAVSVAAANDAPVAAAKTVSTSEDTAVTLLAADLLAGATDVDGDGLRLSSVGNAVGGSVVLNGDGTVTFTPDADVHGTASFDYTVADGQGGFATETVAVSVAAANDAPVVTEDIVNGYEERAVTVTVAELLANDSDIDGDLLTVSWVGNAEGGTVIMDASGNIVFSPTPGYPGISCFEATVSDGLASDTKTVTVNWRPRVIQGNAGGDTIALNDSEFLIEGLGGDDNISAVGDANAVDGGAGSDSLLAEGNDVVLTGGDGADDIEMAGNRATTDGGLGDDCIIVAGMDGTASGGFGADSVEAYGDSNLLDGQVDDDWVYAEGGHNTLLGGDGRDDVEAYGDDNVLNGGVGDDDLYVEGSRNALLGDDGHDYMETWGGIGNILDGGLGDDDLEDYHGTAATLLGGEGDDYLYTNGSGNLLSGGAGYDTLRADAAGNTLLGGGDDDDIKAYRGADGSVLEGGAGADYVRTYANDCILYGGDGDDEVRDWEGMNNSLFGGVGNDYMRIYGTDGYVSGDEGADDLKTYGNRNTLDGGDGDDVLADDGIDSILIGGAGSDKAILNSSIRDVTIVRGEVGAATIVGPQGTTLVSGIETLQFYDAVIRLDGNNAAIAHEDVITGQEDTAVTISSAELLANDIDLEGDALTIVGVDSPYGGSVTLNVDGSVIFIQDADFSGSAGFGYTVMDAQGATAWQMATVMVAAVNDAPVATQDHVTGGGGMPLVIHAAELLSNDIDVDGDVLTIWGVSNAAIGGTASLEQEGSVIFTPDPGFSGTASFDYTVVDPSGAADTKTVSVDILASSVIVARNAAVAGRTVELSTADLLGLVGGSSITAVSSVHGSVSAASDGNLLFTPEDGYEGQAFVEILPDGEEAASRYVLVDVRAPSGQQAKALELSADETRVSVTTTSGTQNYTSIAGLRSGGFVSVWQSGTTSTADIFGRLYAVDGTVLSNEFRVNSYVTSGQTLAEVAGLADGGFVVVWQSLGQDVGTTGVYAQAFNADGTVRGGEFRVNTTTSGTQGYPRIVGLVDGGYVVAWESSDGSGNGVYGQRYGANGVAVGGEFRINTTTTNRQDKVCLSALGDGFVAVWQSYSQDGSGDGVYAQRYSSTGAKLGGEFRANVTTSNYQSNPVVAQLADGSFVIAWDSAGTDICARHFASNGTALGGEFRISEVTGSYTKYPTITATPDGGFVVGWQSSAGATTYDVYARAFDINMSAIGPAQVLSTYITDTQANVSMALLENGLVVAGWDSYLQDGSFTGVYAKLLAVTNYVTGTEASDGLLGSETADVICGGDGDDLILAGGGDDRIQGQAGNDTIIGGAGADAITIESAGGIDTVRNFGRYSDGDQITFSGVYSSHLWFSKVANDLSINVIGTADSVVIDDWYEGTEDRVPGIGVTARSPLDLRQAWPG